MTEPRPASDPRRLACDAAVACLAADPEIPRDLVTRNAIAWRAVHAALDAILGWTTPDNPVASGDAADNSLIGQADKPRHPDGEIYSWEELEAGGWGFCDGCRMWTNGTVERPHQCTATHAHGPVTDDGPTVAECAADDKRWPLQKEGE